MTPITPAPAPDLDKMRSALRELCSSKRNVSRAAFDSLLPEIEQAMREDHPVKAIWKSLHQLGLDVSLATFRKWLTETATSQEQIAE
jgi:hypothetical protein